MLWKTLSGTSLIKYNFRRQKGNVQAKLKRLKQPFAGTGMRKVGVFKEKEKIIVNGKKKTKKSGEI